MGGSVGIIADQNETSSSLQPASSSGSPLHSLSKSATSFLVSLHCESPLIRTEMPSSFYLKIAKESLDFVHKDSLLSIINFPYHSILCWMHDNSMFQFTLDDSGDVTTDSSVPEKITYIIQLRTSRGKEIADILMSTVRYHT